MLSYIIIATVIVSAISLLAIILLFKNKPLAHHHFQYLLSFAAGSLLAVTFAEVLPEALEAGPNLTIFFNVMMISLIVFWLIERFIHWHHCRCDDKEENHGNRQHLVYLNLIGDALHNFLDGIVLAAAFLVNPALGWSTMLATAAHEFPQELGDAAILMRGGLNKTKAIWANVAVGGIAVLGGILGYYFLSYLEKAVPYLLAVAASNFLYLALADLVPELTHEHGGKFWLKQTSSFLLGIVLIYGVIIILE